MLLETGVSFGERFAVGEPVGALVVSAAMALILARGGRPTKASASQDWTQASFFYEGWNATPDENAFCSEEEGALLLFQARSLRCVYVRHGAYRKPRGPC